MVGIDPDADVDVDTAVSEVISVVKSSFLIKSPQTCTLLECHIYLFIYSV